MPPQPPPRRDSAAIPPAGIPTSLVPPTAQTFATKVSSRSNGLDSAAPPSPLAPIPPAVAPSLSAPVASSPRHASPPSTPSSPTAPRAAAAAEPLLLPTPPGTGATTASTPSPALSAALANSPFHSALSLYSRSDALGIVSPTSGSQFSHAADADRVAIDARRFPKWKAMVVAERPGPVALAKKPQAASQQLLPTAASASPLTVAGAGIPARVCLEKVFKFTSSEKFATRVCKGVPNIWRGHVWYHQFTDAVASSLSPTAEEFDARLVEEYRSTQNDECIYDEEIAADAQNALSNHVLFMTPESSGQIGVTRILRAFALRDPAFGYNAAMAKIAAMLLLYMEEERAYIALVHLYHPSPSISARFGLRDLHSSGFPGLPELLFLHDELMRVYAPRLRAKFAAVNLKTMQYATHWYIALFCNCTPCPGVQLLDAFASELDRLLAASVEFGTLPSARGLSTQLVLATFDALLPFRVLVRIWDLYALYGWNILCVIGVALLRKHEAFLMTLERDDMLSFLLPSNTPFLLRLLRRAARPVAASGSHVLAASPSFGSLPRVPIPNLLAHRSPSPARSLNGAGAAAAAPSTNSAYDSDQALPALTGTASAAAKAAAAAAAIVGDGSPGSGGGGGAPHVSSGSSAAGSSATAAAAAAARYRAHLPVPPVWTPDADDAFFQLALGLWNGAAAAMQAPPSAAEAAAAASLQSPPSSASPGGGGGGAFGSLERRGRSGGGGGGAGRDWDPRAGAKRLVPLMQQAHSAGPLKLGMLAGGTEELVRNPAAGAASGGGGAR
ncbi:hypothetical protein HK405_010141, partial [Cladochytrium tenue]